jgi:DinB superfamily
MDEHDRQRMLSALERTRDDFLTAVAGVSEHQARLKPSSDRWSILECAEHVVSAERGMFTAITQRSARLSFPNGHGREEGFLRFGADRSRRYTTAASLEPAGRIPTLAAAVAKFRELRANTIEFVERCNIDLRELEVEHPIGGYVTVQECLALLAVHPARHAAQIREIREALNLDDLATVSTNSQSKRLQKQKHRLE